MLLLKHGLGGIEEKIAEDGETGIKGGVATYLAMTAINLVDVRLSTRHILPSARVKKPIFFLSIG